MIFTFLVFWMILNEAISSQLFAAKLFKFNDEKNHEMMHEDGDRHCCESTEDTIIFCVDYIIKTCASFATSNAIKIIVEGSALEAIHYEYVRNFIYLKELTFLANRQLHQVDPYSFQNSANLETLNFINHPQLKEIDTFVFYGLHNLEHLNLPKNGFQNITLISRALSPYILPRLKQLKLNENCISTINEYEFQPMENTQLEILSMHGCCIENFHPKALRPLRKLKELELGENDMNLKTLVDLLNQTICMGIPLKTINLSSSGFRRAPPKKLLEVIANSNVSSLILKSNQFRNLRNRSFPVFMQNLRFLDLTDVSAEVVRDNAFENIPNLEYLFLGNNRIAFFRADMKLPRLLYLNLEKNTELYGSLFIRNKNQSLGLKNLEILDLQYNELYKLDEVSFGRISTLRSLNLKNCFIANIRENTFREMINLRFLHLENNLLNVLWESQPYPTFDVFEGLKNLEGLYLSGNRLTNFPNAKIIFRSLMNLRLLWLDNNYLQSISAEDFALLSNLEYVDLSHNNILSWDSRVLLQSSLRGLNLDTNAISYLSDSMLKDFQNLTHLVLSHNPFVCDCGNEDKKVDAHILARALELVKDQELRCVQSDVNIIDYLENIENFSGKCDIKKLSSISYCVIALCVILFGFVVIIGLLACIFKWDIKYWIFLATLRMKSNKTKSQQESSEKSTSYQYDAFVSYCNDDRNFVIRMVHMLENYEPYFKLCVFERDFQAGSLISEAIVEHMNKSRKTILVISSSYVKSYWCAWGSRIAEHHQLYLDDSNLGFTNNNIILIKLRSIDETNLTPFLKYLIRTKIYLEWASEEDLQNRFWEKLKNFLTIPGSAQGAL